jgi:FdhD protein
MRVKINSMEKTGGVHFSGLFSSDLELKHFASDIGRHNAVDKVVGKSLLTGEDFSDKILFTTGRISSDIVVKCLRIGIPMIVSKNSPLHTAITLARKYNLCLIGYLRGNRFDVFSGDDVVDE